MRVEGRVLLDLPNCCCVYVFVWILLETWNRYLKIPRFSRGAKYGKGYKTDRE